MTTAAPIDASADVEPLWIGRSELRELMYATMRRAATVVPRDVTEALDSALNIETSETARLHVLTSLRNFELSASGEGLVCTDTGWPLYYVMLGDDVRIEGGLSELDRAAAEAVRRCTAESLLRDTMVHPITRRPLDRNTGLAFPCVNVRFDPQLDGIRVIAVPKGGGGDIFGGFFRMLLAADGMTGAMKFVLDCFRESTRAGKTCPPNIIGICLGGTPDVCMTLAKEACVLRVVGERHPGPSIAKLERELLAAFNDSGVGPMGCGGAVAALDVHIEVAATHPAALAVGFNAQCQIGRRAVAEIGREGRMVFKDDPGWGSRT
jgi:tartrate/fumarate subfamily iron-sulfur-dependent hydro-lyase alpha chain